MMILEEIVQHFHYNVTQFQKKYPDEASWYKQRGDLYLSIENFDEAISDFKNAMQIDTSNKEYFSLLMQVMLDSGKFSELVEGKTPYYLIILLICSLMLFLAGINFLQNK